MPSLTFDTPTGPFTLIQEGDAIVRAGWRPCEDQTPTTLLLGARDQVEAYFAGDLTGFDLPLEVQGSEFQHAVCAAMSAIPFGETRTYGDLAKALSAPAQAIGQACGGNPIPLIIPCHRVVSATGLGGFSGEGGVESKVQLLKHEGAASLLI
ncbi:MAG: methylated-DNA--[protein]-cysteine S-methyltransferase [Pelagimonas sp.]|jgi:methylated-DNA-[protein]-cysteine S-methyltransferase|nr:methylated-DNA--[protein]-cysteine S-methyltransferase [Pelagimonas sp.]